MQGVWSSLPPSSQNAQTYSQSLSGYQWLQSNSRPSTKPSQASRAIQNGTTNSIRPGGVVPANEVDLLQKKGHAAVLQAVYTPPGAEAGEWQAPIVYVDYTRNQLSPAVLSCLEVRPNTVILHVYDLNAGLTQANELTGFHAGIGGAFHAGVEVYGGEWAYGVCGVDCELPRSTTCHAYKCSVIVGCTALDRRGVAEVLKLLVDEWYGTDYDTLGRNCCNFAAVFCERLGCESLPPWVDRFPRLLHGGQQAGLQAKSQMQAITTRTSQYAQETLIKAQPHVEYAAEKGNEMILASRAAMAQADQHAQRWMAGLWENVHSAVQHVRNRNATIESVDEEAEEDSLESTSPIHQGTMSESPNPSLFGPLPALTTPRGFSTDTTSTLPAYPGFDTQSNLVALNYPPLDCYSGGVNTMPSLVSASAPSTHRGTQVFHTSSEQATNVFTSTSSAPVGTHSYAAPSAAYAAPSAISNRTTSMASASGEQQTSFPVRTVSLHRPTLSALDSRTTSITSASPQYIANGSHQAPIQATTNSSGPIQIHSGQII